MPMKTLFFVFVFVALTSCHYWSCNNIPEAKAKVLVSNNILTIMDSNLEYYQCGDTIMVEKYHGFSVSQTFSLANSFFTKDTIVHKNDIEWIEYYYVVILEILPKDQSLENNKKRYI